MATQVQANWLVPITHYRGIILLFLAYKNLLLNVLSDISVTQNAYATLQPRTP
jgi:hypothetical protein